MIYYITFSVLVGIAKTWYYLKYEEHSEKIAIAVSMKPKATAFVLFIGHMVLAPLFFIELTYLIAVNTKIKN